jgi:hypothetical protein
VRSETHERNPATRGYTTEQATALFMANGFEIEGLVSGFTLEPYDPARPDARAGARVFTVIGRRR